MPAILSSMAKESPLRRVVEALGTLGLDAILELEKRDPQYIAVCRVWEAQGEEVCASLSMLNALVSYRLSGKGEEHWQFFGDYFSRQRVTDVCTQFLAYLRASPFLKIGREARERRVRKVCGYRPNLENLLETWRRMSALLDVDPGQKTVVFAVKILNYVYRCSRGVERVLPMEIPLPVDYRVAHLTWCAGLIDVPPDVAMRQYKAVQAVWNTVAEVSGIPPLHIDTVLWLAGRILHGENIHNIPLKIIDALLWREDCKRISRPR